VTTHEEHQENVGAYLLGALEPDEQSAFEGHLASCHECRAEVDQLRMAADALPRSVEPFHAPASLKRSLMEVVREEAKEGAPGRRPLLERLGIRGLFGPGMRPQLAGAAAALLLILGVALGEGISQLTGGDSSNGDGTRVVAAVVDRSRVQNASATLTVPSGNHGAQLRVSGLPAPKPGQVYEIWLKRGEQLQPGPLFSVDSQGNGAGAIPDDLDGVSTVLVTRERTGGAQKPSEVPIISARI
jgi:anti-sigma factor RsiW